MKPPIKSIAAFVFAALIGASLGDSTHSAKAQAASVQVTMSCNTVQVNNAGQPNQSVTVGCANASTDTSGVTVTMSITQTTQRYPVGVNAAITLP